MIEAHAIAKEEAITYDGKPEHLDSFVENSKSTAGRKRQRLDASTSGSLHSHFELMTELMRRTSFIVF